MYSYRLGQYFCWKVINNDLFILLFKCSSRVVFWISNIRLLFISDTLVVNAPTSSLSANTVWGALRGILVFISLVKVFVFFKIICCSDNSIHSEKRNCYTKVNNKIRIFIALLLSIINFLSTHLNIANSMFI